MGLNRGEIEYHTPDTLPEDVNPWMNQDITDFLYHLGFDNHGNGLNGSMYEWKNLQEIFGDVTHVCMGGSPERASRFAQSLSHEQGMGFYKNEAIGKTDRFSLYKVGKVISVSHGMASGSMSILLHEISKMLYYAKGCDINKLRNEVSYIRMGTSGGLGAKNDELGEGLGVKGGTVVISSHGVNQEGVEKHTVWKRNERWEYPTQLNTDLSERIRTANVVDEVGKQVHTVLGKTMGTDCFYEAQGRLDGFFNPGYSEEDKLSYLKMLFDKGVRNIEMEAGYFSSFCLRAGIPGAIVCVALLNRLNGDQVTENLDEISENAEKIMIPFLRNEGAI